MLAEQCSYSFASKDDRLRLFDLYSLVMKKPISEIWGWEESWQEKDFADHFEPEQICMISLGDELVGYYQTEETAGFLYIRMFVIHPGYQGKGLGTHALQQIMVSACAGGVDVSLRVFRSNKRAIKFYLKHGFIVAEESAEFLVLKKSCA